MFEINNPTSDNMNLYSSLEQDQNQIPLKPKRRLGLSILSTVVGLSSVYMCCIGAILGAIAIVFATQVDTKYYREDFNGAQSSSQTALILSVISLGISLIGILILIFFYAIGDTIDVGSLGAELGKGVIDRLR